MCTQIPAHSQICLVPAAQRLTPVCRASLRSHCDATLSSAGWKWIRLQSSPCEYTHLYCTGTTFQHHVNNSSTYQGTEGNVFLPPPFLSPFSGSLKRPPQGDLFFKVKTSTFTNGGGPRPRTAAQYLCIAVRGRRIYAKRLGRHTKQVHMLFFSFLTSSNFPSGFWRAGEIGKESLMTQARNLS